MFVREGIKLGPLFIHYYGVIIMVGALIAAWLTSEQAKRKGQNPEVVWDFLPWVLIFGILGARLWHILTPSDSWQALGYTPQYYFSHPLDAIAIWNGGLGIPGAIFGGILALFIYCKNNHLNFGQWTDFLAPGLALAQAIGRWGNYINQEVYGAPTDLPWKIYIDPAHRIAGYENIAYYHPLFLYESIYNLMNFGVLMWLSRKHGNSLLDGDLFVIYLGNYAAGRFFLEFLRLDASSVGTLNANQTLMMIVFVGSLITLLLRHAGKKPGYQVPAG